MIFNFFINGGSTEAQKPKTFFALISPFFLDLGSKDLGHGSETLADISN
jgi:hypothetical protein